LLLVEDDILTELTEYIQNIKLWWQFGGQWF
jgi:hypothetical protein